MYFLYCCPRPCQPHKDWGGGGWGIISCRSDGEHGHSALLEILKTRSHRLSAPSDFSYDFGVARPDPVIQGSRCERRHMALLEILRNIHTKTFLNISHIFYQYSRKCERHQVKHDAGFTTNYYHDYI